MNIKADGYIEKASRLSEGEVEFVVSTNAIDAHGERINIDGIDVADFKKNPVYYGGMTDLICQSPKLLRFGKEGGKLMARAKST
jgi:hypothetical protein